LSVNTVTKFSIGNVLLIITYFVAGQFTLTLSLPPSGATPLWAPAGIALAAVLIWGYRLLPGVFIGDFLVAVDLIGLSDSTAILLCLIIGAQAAFHAWLARYLLERYKVWPSALTEEYAIIKFFVIAGIVASFFPAALTVILDLMIGVLTASTWLESLIVWWIGGALGVVVFAPIGLILFASPKKVWRVRIIPVALPMAIMFTLLVITLHGVRINESRQMEERFNNYTGIAHALADGQLNNYSSLLRGFNAFYKHSGHVTDAEFDTFTTESLREQSDVYAAFWMERVLDKDRANYEEALGKSITVLNKTTNKYVTSESKPEYLVVKQSRLPSEHIQAPNQPLGFIGVDFCSQNNKTQCKLLFEEGITQTVKPYLTDIDPSAKTRVIRLSPVVKDSEVIGAVGHVYQYKALFEKLLSSDIKKWLDWTVISVSDDRVLFDTRTSNNRPEVFSNFALSVEQTVEFGSQQWRFIYQPSPQFVASYSSWNFFWMITASLILLSLIGAWLMAMSGRVHQIRQQVTDQTNEIIHASELLQKSESKYRSLVENIDDEYLIYSQNREGVFDYISPSVNTILGYSQEGFLSHYASYLTESKLNQQFESYTQKALAGNTASYELEIYDTEGYIHTFAITSTPVMNDNANVIGVESIAHDITERKEAQVALEKLSLAIMHSPNAVIITNNRGIIEYINPRFTEITGYTLDEVLGRLPSVLKSGTTLLSVYKDLWDTVLSGREWRGELQNRKKNGDFYWSREHICPLSDADGKVTHFVSTQEDVTEAKRQAEETIHQASHDLLTGLFNRREFEFRLSRVIQSSKSDLSEHALCFMDLDQFKIINDTCGHVAGDELLRQVGDLLLANVRQRDTLARLGGDEFVLLMEHCGIEQAYDACEKIISLLENFRFHWEEHVFTIGISIGMTVIDLHVKDSTEALSRVDGACYAAKDAGRNRVEVYTEDSERLRQRKGEIQWSSEISHALDNDRFVLYAQPIIPLQRQSLDLSYEVLLRLQMPDGSIVPPGAFLPAAERYNSATRIDRWVVTHALQWLSINAKALNHINSISINLSGQSLGDDSMLGFIIKEFQQGSVPIEKIKFEITETAAIANLRDATVFMRTLAELGCRFALDDFGSGLSSFAYLKNLKVNVLKIDGMFVRDMLDDPIDFEMVKSINDIGHVMGLETIAEFVESDEIAEKLREIGVDYAQGFALGKPIPIDDILKGQ